MQVSFPLFLPRFSAGTATILSISCRKEFNTENQVIQNHWMSHRKVRRGPDRWKDHAAAGFWGYNPVAVNQRPGNHCQPPEVKELLPVSQLPHIQEASHFLWDGKSVHSKNSFLPEPTTAIVIKMASACISPSKSHRRHLKLWQQGRLRNVVVSLPASVIQGACTQKRVNTNTASWQMHSWSIPWSFLLRCQTFSVT